MGGKAYLTNWLCGFIPEHVTYVEPFCGASHLLFAKPLSQVEILNDIDDNLVNLYKVIQNDEKRQKLINILNETPYSRSVFRSWKYGDKTTLDDIEKAVRYFYLSKASFAGDVSFGGFACPSRSTRRNPARTYQNSIDALEHIAKRLKGVTFECLDYQKCIGGYDSEQSLFYIDCPYHRHEVYYGDTFTEKDHYKLSNILHSVRGKVMLSHYECDTYNELYSDWNKYTFQSFKGSHKSTGESKPKTQECLFTNFEPQIKTQGLFNGNKSIN